MLPHPGGTGSCRQLSPAGQSPPQKLSCPPQWSGPRHAQCPFPSSPHVWLSGQSPPQNDAGFPPQFGSPSVVVVGHGSLVLVVVVVTVQQKPIASGVRVTSAGRHASRIFTVVLKVPSRPRLAHSTAASAAPVNKRIAVTATARRITRTVLSHLCRRGVKLVKGGDVTRPFCAPDIVLSLPRAPESAAGGAGAGARAARRVVRPPARSSSRPGPPRPSSAPRCTPPTPMLR